MFRHDVPEDVVENFAIKHNLSEQAKNKLLENVYEQLNEESNVSGTMGARQNYQEPPPTVNLQALRKVIDQIWARHDLDRNGTLDRSEARGFVKTVLGAMRARSAGIDNYCDDLFRRIDKDRSGTISKYEMTLYLK